MKYKIGFLGMGTVAQGVWRHLSENREFMTAKLGAEYELAKVCVRDPSKSRGVSIDESLITQNPLDVVSNPEIDIVCELMGGVEFAYKCVKTALENGKIVITANKALLCERGAELVELAQKIDKAELFFEASVAGGIPIVKSLGEGLVANRFSLIYGILNGTCNYILTRMERESASYESILADARKLGYVEADESLDIDGIDTAHKAAVLAYLAYGKWIPLSDMVIEGIRKVRLEDMLWAKEFDYRIKLLATIRKNLETEMVSVSVCPTLVPLSDLVANVNEVFNAVAVEGDLVGRTVYMGRGAGQNPTASAVISDISDAFETLKSKPIRSLLPSVDAGGIMPLSDMKSSFYIRLSVKDELGILARVASILAKHKISIELLEQKKHKNANEAWLILTTHKTDELSMRKACQELEESEFVLDKPFILRIFKNS